MKQFLIKKSAKAFTVCAALGLSLVEAKPAEAALVTYNDRNVFIGNTTFLNTIDFETAPPNDSHYYGGSANFGNVTFFDSGDNGLSTVDAGLNGYDYGSGAGLVNNDDGFVTNVNFSAPVTAVGFDFMDVFNDGWASFVFEINDETFTWQTQERPEPTFFGFTSDDAITTFSYRSTGVNPNVIPSEGNYALIDNFSFGTAAITPGPEAPTAAVPEPGTWALMGVAMLFMAVVQLRKKRDGAMSAFTA